MVRLSALFWLALVVVTGFAMFKVKYTVQELDEELNRTRKQAAAEQQEIRVLNAEWSYLTQPERLAELNRKFLSLGPVQTKQLQHAIDEFPVRPLPPETPASPANASAAQAVASAVITVPPPAPMVPAPTAAPPVAAAAAPVAPATVANAAPAPVPGFAPAPTPVWTPPQALPVTPAVVKAPAAATAKVQLAKANTSRPARTLNDLFAEIDGGR